MLTIDAFDDHTYPASVDNVIEVEIVRAADGAAGVGHHPDGRVMFIDGALPGERVKAAITQEHKRHLRATALDILEPSSGRISPVCATRDAGCGGCDFAHADLATQHQIKAAVVRDALIRIGRLAPDVANRAVAPEVLTVDEPYRYRTTVRAAINEGRACYRRAGSHDMVIADVCRVSHEGVEQLLQELRFRSSAGDEVVIRVSAATGDRMIVIDGDAAEVEAPDDVVIVTKAELETGRTAAITEHAAGRDWQISAGSFFQPGPAIATLLTETVASRVGDLEGSTLVDAYAGVGLFAGSVGATAEAIIAIERAGSSTRDSRVNLAELPARVVEAAVEDWEPEPADVVIADPARAGLAKAGVSVLDRCGAETFVLVSCDTGSLGRDVGLLTAAGYTLEAVDLVDAFADTSHIEVVSTLRR